MGTIPEKMVVFILVKEFFDWLHPQRPTSAVPPIAMTQAFNDPLEAHLDGVGTVTFVDACQLVASNPSRLNLRSKSHSSWERTPARCHCERKSSNSTAPSKFSSDSGSGCAAEVSSEVTECRFSPKAQRIRRLWKSLASAMGK